MKTATALLVVDMQEVFREMTHIALPNVLTLCEHFDAHQQLLIMTQHGHTDAELTPPYKNQLVRKWRPEGSIAVGSAGWRLMFEIKKYVDFDKDLSVIAKNTYDAFIHTDLEKVLRDNAIERVVVCGVMTDCCCDTTARSAFNRGFETWLVSDACGSANEKQHEAGLRGFGFAFGEVLETKEVLKRLSEED